MNKNILLHFQIKKNQLKKNRKYKLWKIKELIGKNLKTISGWKIINIFIFVQFMSIVGITG